MSFRVSKDGTQESAKPYSSLGGIPYMYGSGDNTTGVTSASTTLSPTSGTADRFGQGVAIGGGRIVVTDPQDDTYGNVGGIGYLYDLDGTLITTFVGSGINGFDYFGGRDGNGVAIGSSRIVCSGEGTHIYIFDMNGTELATLSPSDFGFTGGGNGESVDVGCGVIVSGAPINTNNGSNSGSFYIINLTGTTCIEIDEPTTWAGADHYFGWSVAVGNDRIVVGAPGDRSLDPGVTPGAAYIFDLDGNFIKRLTDPAGINDDQYGYSVAVGQGRIVVGSTHDDSGTNDGGAIWIYDLDGNLINTVYGTNVGNDGYGEIGTILRIGSGRIVSFSANSLTIGSPNTYGKIIIYDLDGNLIERIGADTSFSQYGFSGDIFNGKLIVTAPDATSPSQGYAHLYDVPAVITPYDLIDWERGY